MNVVVLQGTLSKDGVRRTLPSGTELINLEVTTPVEDARVSVPVAWFDPPARVPRLEAGAEVLVIGNVRRRFFRAGGTTQSRTEVVVHRLIAARPGAARDRALARARDALS